MSTRPLFFIAATVCIGLVAGAVWFQHWDGLTPCPLCIIQRIAFLGAGVALVVGGLIPHHGVGRGCAGVAGVAAVLGAAVAGRHVWLQNLPAEQVPECGPGLSFLLDVFPLRDALSLILRGSGECAEVQWTLLGLSMPAWSLVWLMTVAGVSFYLVCRHRLISIS